MIKQTMSKSKKEPVSEEVKTVDDIDVVNKETTKIIKRTRLKIIVLSVVNIILVGLTLVILGKLSPLSEHIKELRGESILAQETSDVAVLKSEIEKYSENVNKLKEIFADEEGFIRFVSKLDSLKAEGTIVEFVFPSSKPVIDKEKNLGFPVSLKFQGSAEAVNTSLTAVMSLPYILKPVNVELAISSENEIVLEFDGFLIVNESFTAN